MNGQSKPHARQVPTFARSVLRQQFWQLRANWAVAQLILQSPVQPQPQPKPIITTFALGFPAADANPAQTKHLPPLPPRFASLLSLMQQASCRPQLPLTIAIHTLHPAHIPPLR